MVFNEDDFEKRTKPKVHLPKETFLVRWPIAQAEFEKIDRAGVEITVKEVVPATPVTTPSGQKADVSYLVKTSKGGLIPIAYLQPRAPYEIRTDLEKEVVKGFAYQDWRLGTGSWWLGQVSPPEAAGVFNAVSWYHGEYAVCQPPEWQEEKEWGEMCLLVRTMTGDIDQIWHEWRETEYYNMRFAKALGHERQQQYDMLPLQPACPPHGFLYFTIRRSEQGDFFIESGKEFNSLEKLLDYYYTNALPVKEAPAKKNKTNLVLRLPADVNMTPFSSPRPMLYPMKCPGYKLEPFKLVLGQKEGQPMTAYHPIKWKIQVQRREFDEGAEGASKKGEAAKRDITKRAYFMLDGRYGPVAVRELIKNFSRKAFEKDMTRIHHADGTNYVKAHKEVIKADLKSTKFRQGHNFLAHIVAYGETNKENWIAYEGLNGIPLDRLLMKRRYDDWWISPRSRLEIAYQVAGGMRFLEENFLCHRHLRAANVCVYAEHLGTISVKITDYMIPYSFLDPEFVSEVDLMDLEWPWWAPECVRFRHFDIISDIWAYGCLIFELVHFGLPPYSFEEPKMNSVQDLVKFFGTECKMKTVEGDELETYLDDIMQMCWRTVYEERPTFDHLYSMLRQLLFDATIGPEKTIDQFLAQDVPKKFPHKWARTKTKDRTIDKDNKTD